MIISLAGLRRARAWWLFVMVGRLGILAGMLTTALSQIQYLPRPLWSCENYDKWNDPSGVPPGTETIWEVLPIYRAWSQQAKKYILVSICGITVRSLGLECAIM